MKRFSFLLVIVFLCVDASAAESARPAGKAPARPKADERPDYTQKLRPDPNYRGSAEDRYRQRMMKRAEKKRKAEQERLLYLQLAKAAAEAPCECYWSPPLPFLGAALFAGAGGVIGHQYHHGWEGAAIGAGVGAIFDAYRWRSCRRTPCWSWWY